MATTRLTAQAVAELVGGRLLGNGSVEIQSVAPLDRAGPADLSLFTTRAYSEELLHTKAAAVLVTEPLSAEAAARTTCIVVADPARAMSTVVRHFLPAPAVRPGIHPSARLGDGVALGRDVSIGSGVVLGADVHIGDGSTVGAGSVLRDGVVLGEGCRLEENVICGQGVRLGARVAIKANSVLGGVGFGFHSDAGGHQRIPHAGGLEIGDDVEIGSLCTIDRGSLGDTTIGRGTKIDNMVHLAHNVRVGEHSILAGGVLVAGSTRIGNFVVIGGGCGIADHVTIGDRAVLAARTGLDVDVPAGAVFGGYNGRDHRKSLRVQAAGMRLPAILKTLERMVRERGDV